jgi:two-component system, NarL family, nitrate/nitrite response regulator NarL
MKFCLVCDDHALMRAALAGAVKLAWPDAEVQTAKDFPEAWLAAEARPDLILCDLGMPGADPLAGIGRLVQLAHGCPILVVTGNEEDEFMLPLFDMGVAGFVPKSAGAEVMEAAMRIVVSGSRYLPPRLLDLVTGTGGGRASGDAALARLTARQIEVLRLLARGEANKEIARALDLSPATVKTHVAAVLTALRAANRTEAASRARELRLI